MQSSSLFPDMTKVVDIRLKNADVSRTQAACHVIYRLFGPSSGKIELPSFINPRPTHL